MNGKLLNELKGVSKKIAKWFMQKPETMDSDLKLMCNIWSEEMFNKTGLHPKELTAYDLLCMLALKDLSNPESIRRSRVELQKKNPEFRGKTWEKRKKKMQQKNLLHLQHHLVVLDFMMSQNQNKCKLKS